MLHRDIYYTVLERTVNHSRDGRHEATSFIPRSPTGRPEIDRGMCRTGEHAGLWRPQSDLEEFCSLVCAPSY